MRIDLNIGNVEEEIQVIRIMIARHLEMRVNNPPSSAEESLTNLPKVPKGGVSSVLPLLASPASCVCVKTYLKNSLSRMIGWMTSWVMPLLTKVPAVVSGNSPMTPMLPSNEPALRSSIVHRLWSVVYLYSFLFVPPDRKSRWFTGSPMFLGRRPPRPQGVPSFLGAFRGFVPPIQQKLFARTHGSCAILKQ